MFIWLTKAERKLCRQSGLLLPRFFLFTSTERYERYIDHANDQHAEHENDAELRARAIMRIFWEKKGKGWKGCWGLLALVMALALAAPAQSPFGGGNPLGGSQINTIEIQDSTGATLKRFASPFIFKCDTTMVCSISGRTLTVASAGGGTGTVTSVSSGNLAPLFTVAITNPTSTPAFAFALSNAGAHTFFGNNTGSTAAPGFQAIGVNDLPAHNLLSATHGDTAAASPVRGDGLFAISGTTWQRLAHPSVTGGYFKWNGTDIVASTLAASGTGACGANLFASTLNADAAPTCTQPAYAGITGTPTLHYETVQDEGGALTQEPTINFIGAGVTCVDNAGATKTDCTITSGGGSGTVTSIATTSPISGGTITTTGTISCPNCVDKTLSNTYSTPTTQTLDTALVKYYNDAPIFNASRYAGADPCAKIAAVYADAAYTAATKAIIDATGFAGDQACGTNALAVTRNTWIQLGAVTLHATVQQTFGWPSTTRLTTPAAPVLASSTTTGGTLSGAVFVKVTLAGPFPGIVGGVNITETLASAETSFAMNAACTGTPTCTATVTAPTAQLGSPGYYVYEANTTGAEKLCNVAPMPFGTNYVIKANCAGTVPSGANLADVDMNVLSGIGQSTRWSMDCAGCNLNVNAWDWWLRDFEVVGTRTDYNTTAMLVVFSNTIIDRLTFVGGHTHIAASGVANLTIRGTTHSGHTVAGHGILVQGNSDVWIDGVTFLPGVMPLASGLFAGVYLQNTSRFRISNINAYNLDFSQNSNATAVAIDNSSYGTLNVINCDGLTNADCWLVTGLSHNVEVMSTTCRRANFLTPIGTNGNNGDCGDVFSAGQVKITGFDADSGSAIAGFKPPLLEIYNSQDVTLTGANIHNGSGEGISTFGTPGARFIAMDVSLNQNSGMLVQDFSGTVSCNGTTTVTRVSGQTFGPWNIGTPVTINGSPFTIAAILTSTNSLTVNTTCATIASTTLTLSTNDMLISNSNFDTNGRNATHVATTSEGLVFSGSNQALLSNVSANDNQTTKHQTFGIRLNNTARIVVHGFNAAGNLTAPYIDNPGNSIFCFDNGVDNTLLCTGLKVVNADFTTAANTNLQTITGLTFTLPALTAVRYGVDCHLIYSQATAGVAATGFGVQAATFAPTNIFGTGLMQTAASTFTGGALATLNTTTATNIVTATPTVTTNWMTDLHMDIQNPSNASAQVLNIMVRTGNTADLVTVHKDSFCSIQGLK